MLLRHRPVYLLRTVVISLVIFAAVKYWHPSNGIGRSTWDETSAVENYVPPFPVDGKPTTPDPRLDDGDKGQHPVGLDSSQIKEHAVPAPMDKRPKSGSQAPIGAGTDTSDIDTSPLPLPTDYKTAPASTSDFCLNRFTTKWFDLMHAGHNQYCLASAASRLHCFHTPSNLRNDGHIDSFCVAQNAVFDPHMDRFTLDCPLTIRVPQGMPKTPIHMHEYWYETGPRAILLNYIAIDDRAEIVQHHKIKAPVSKGPWKKREESAPLDADVEYSRSRRAVQAETAGPRTFTLLLKRESAYNPFHVLHELMSLQLTFDTLRSYRDPSTNAPFYISKEDFDNTQIVIVDTHADGPMFELLDMFTARKPKRLIQLTHKGAAEAAEMTGQEDYTSWLKTGSLDNIIIPLAGGANSVWHDNWEKWDCRYELRQVFVKKVLDFYGFKSDDDDLKKSNDAGRVLGRRDIAPNSEPGPRAEYGGRAPGSPAAAAGAAARGSAGTAKPKVPASSSKKSKTTDSAKDKQEAQSEAGASGNSRILKEGLEAHMEKVFGKQPSPWDDEPTPEDGKSADKESTSRTEKIELERSESGDTKRRDEDKTTESGRTNDKEKPLLKEEDAPKEKSNDDTSASTVEKQESSAAKDKSDTSEPPKETDKPVERDSERKETASDKNGENKDGDKEKDGEEKKDNEQKKEDERKKEDEAKKEDEPKKEEEEKEKPKEPGGPSPLDGSPSSSPEAPTLKAVDIPPPPANAIVITFIDRKSTRRITKHEELVSHARQSLSSSRPIHIQSLDLAQYSFRDQIAIARKTDILVGVHGAGLTHTMFMRQGVGALVEIFPEGLELRCFQAMAKDREMGYHKMVVPVVEKKKDWHEVDVVVDKEEFVGVLRDAVKAIG